MDHKELIKKIQAEGLTIEKISDSINVSSMTLYRLKKSDTISDKRHRDLTDLYEDIRKKRQSLDIEHKIFLEGSTDMECDFCFEKAILFLLPDDDRATDLRLCRFHAKELQTLLNNLLK